jgi:hypothetical protein
MKTCSCGRQFTKKQWEALSYVGILQDEMDTFEMRNCECGSTIAIALELADIHRDEDMLAFAMELQ